MIRKIEIQNYRSFEHVVDLPLNNLNIIIGPNGSGKTNFLEVFNLFSRASKKKLGEHFLKLGGYQQVVHMMDTDQKIFFKFEIEGLENTLLVYKLQLTERKGLSVPVVWYEQLAKIREDGPPLYLAHRDKNYVYFHNRSTGTNDYISRQYDEHALKNEPELEDSNIVNTELMISQIISPFNYPTPDKLVRLFNSWMLYKPINVGDNSPLRYPQLIGAEKILSVTGENIIPVLYNIQSNDIDAWDEIIEDIKAFYPNFSNISFPMEGGAGKLGLVWWESIKDKTVKYTANQLSDGTLRLLALEAILSNPNPPPLICIDEPELSMHPDWIRLIADLMKRATSTGKTQIIAATHSPELVSEFEPEDVIVIEKTNGKSEPRRLERADLTEWLRNYRLGDLWKKGVLGGRPLWEE